MQLCFQRVLQLVIFICQRISYQQVFLLSIYINSVDRIVGFMIIANLLLPLKTTKSLNIYSKKLQYRVFINTHSACMYGCVIKKRALFPTLCIICQYKGDIDFVSQFLRSKTKDAFVLHKVKEQLKRKEIPLLNVQYRATYQQFSLHYDLV